MYIFFILSWKELVILITRKCAEVQHAEDMKRCQSCSFFNINCLEREPKQLVRQWTPFLSHRNSEVPRSSLSEWKAYYLFIFRMNIHSTQLWLIKSLKWNRLVDTSTSIYKRNGCIPMFWKGSNLWQYTNDVGKRCVCP